MKSCFFAKSIRNCTPHIFILMLMFNTGCGAIITSPSKTLEIKSFEEIAEEKYKKLRTTRELTLSMEISSQIFITPGAPYYSVKYLKAELKILPVEDSRQNILSYAIKPPGKRVGDSLEYVLDTPSPGPHEFRLRTEVACRYEFVKVTKKIPYPLHVTEAELIKYKKPSLIIDSDNRDVRELAASLAEGEDDLYSVVFKACDWVMKNVHSEYDASTVYTSQKASWVLKNREGVCDEKTNLLIGLLRSLDIPARFITGFAGINYSHKIIFKPHGWAEVYFPSAGWIPFDVSYNQLGFVDATHIKLLESVDTSDALTSFELITVDISDRHTSDEGGPGNDLISIKDLKIKTKIKQETGTVAPLLTVTPKIWHNNIATGSYNVLEATVSNPNEFYVTADLSPQIPVELEIVGESNKMLLMKPGERATVYWIVKPTIDRMKNRVFTFPVNIVTSRSDPAAVEFHVAQNQGYPRYSLEKLKNQVERKIEKEL